MESQRTLLINLKVLSKLQPHQRLDTSGSLYHISSPAQAFWISLTRWWSGARRSIDIARIQTLYESAMGELEASGEHAVLRAAMADSLTGLEHLKTTYDGDVTAVANIEYIIDVVAATLRQHRALHAHDDGDGDAVQDAS